MNEKKQPVMIDEDKVAGAVESDYDYGDEMKSTRDKTSKEHWRPQLFENGQVVRKQVNEGTEKRPIMNWKQFVVRRAKQIRTNGKWKYQLDYENKGVAAGPFAEQDWFLEPELKDPLGVTGLSH